MATQRELQVMRARRSMADAKGRIDMQVMIGDTAYGQIVRKLGDDARVAVNGRRVPVLDLDGAPHVIVEELPRDIDTTGY